MENTVKQSALLSVPKNYSKIIYGIKSKQSPNKKSPEKVFHKLRLLFFHTFGTLELALKPNTAAPCKVLNSNLHFLQMENEPTNPI